MPYNVKSFYDSEIAMMEHEIINDACICDWRPEDLQMYMMGVHDMAQKVIENIQKGFSE